MIRRRFAWKIQSTLDLTGPGVFSDAVHEFLEDNSEDAVQKEIGFRQSPPGAHYLSFPSEKLYLGHALEMNCIFFPGRLF